MNTSKSELEKREILRMSNEESNKLTRECLQTALIYLMNEKPFEKITITELVKRSGVSRTAFYRNYASKEDILKEFSDWFLKELIAFSEDEQYKEHPYLWYLRFFSSIKEHADILQLLIKANMPAGMDHTASSFIEKIKPAHTSLEYYKNLAFEGAFSKILLGWFQKGMQESPEEMARLCKEIIHE